MQIFGCLKLWKKPINKVKLIEDGDLLSQAKTLHVSSAKGEVKTDAPEQAKEKVKDTKDSDEIPF